MAKGSQLLVAQYSQCFKLIDECAMVANLLVQHGSKALPKEGCPEEIEGSRLVEGGVLPESQSQQKTEVAATLPQAGAVRQRPTAVKSNSLKPPVPPAGAVNATLRVPKAAGPPTSVPLSAGGQQEQLNATSVAQTSAEPIAKRARVEALSESPSSEIQRPAARPNAAELKARLLALREKQAELSHLRDQTVHHEQLQAALRDSESQDHGGSDLPQEFATAGKISQQNRPRLDSGGVVATAAQPAAGNTVSENNGKQVDEDGSDDDMDDGDLMASLQSALAPPCLEHVPARTPSCEPQEGCSSALAASHTQLQPAKGVLQQNMVNREDEEEVQEVEMVEEDDEDEEEEEDRAEDQGEEVEVQPGEGIGEMETVAEGMLREETEDRQPCELVDVGEVTSSVAQMNDPESDEADSDEALEITDSGTDLGTLLGEVFGQEARSKGIQISEGQVSCTEAADDWSFSMHGHGADGGQSGMPAAEPADSPEVVESPELFDVSEEPVEMQSRGEVLGACVIDAMSDEEEEDEEDYDPFSTEPMPI